MFWKSWGACPLPLLPLSTPDSISCGRQNAAECSHPAVLVGRLWHPTALAQMMATRTMSKPVEAGVLEVLEPYKCWAACPLSLYSLSTPDSTSCGRQNAAGCSRLAVLAAQLQHHTALAKFSHPEHWQACAGLPWLMSWNCWAACPLPLSPLSTSDGISSGRQNAAERSCLAVAQVWQKVRPCRA